MAGGDPKLAKIGAKAATIVDNPLIVGDVAVVRRRVRTLKTARDVRTEMSFVYRQVWLGQLDTMSAGRLTAMLREIMQGLKIEAELEMLQQGYADAWTGIALRGPERLPKTLPPPTKGAESA